MTVSTGSVANPYRFGGAYGAYTDSSGLVKIGQRFYDPSLGRWTQQDLPGTLFNPMTLNRYIYADCNPINSIDPSGASLACTLGGLSSAGGIALLFIAPPAGVPLTIAAVAVWAAGTESWALSCPGKAVGYV